MTAKEIMDEFGERGMSSMLGRLIVKAVLAKLPRILSTAVSGEAVQLILEDGKTLDLSPAMVEAFADTPLDALKITVTDAQPR